MLKIKQFIGDKKFYKTTFAIILPIMIQQLFLSIAGYVDSLMINGYGGASTAAYDGVSSANKIMFVLNFIWIGFAATASIFVAQYYGAKNKEKVTGYNYTPEHLRYVGVVLAKYLKKNNLTLEEYYS